MVTRELYKQKFEAQLHEWSAKIDAFTAHTEKLTAEARIDMKPHIDTVGDKFTAAKAKLHHIAEATDDKWDDMTKDVDHAWNDLKSAVTGAYDALKARNKKN